ncbi:hypothetical protein BD414DRAFT_498336 [Trametes punicea]|nr:hypothetical protein BD414DRAFT_498336 [Trametes punicea]
MSDGRPTKRTRTNEATEEVTSARRSQTLTTTSPPAESTDIKRDEEIWFPNGNVIIIADNKVAFRLYRGVLSRLSEVFRGLFAIPLPPDSEEMDGCPLVHLSDSPDDLKCLFMVLCRRKNYFYRRDEPIPVPFSVLASLIRMGHKYGIQEVYNTALRRLKKSYTSSMTEWISPQLRKRYVKTTELDAPAVIELARLTNNPDLLPSAYLACCSLHCVARGRKRARDQVEPPPWDLQNILAGRAKLVQRRALNLLALLRVPPCDNCARPEQCAMAVQRTLQRIDLADLESSLLDKDAFTSLSGWFWMRGQTERLCGPCTQASDKAELETREQTWRNLPEIFDIHVENWPEPQTLPPLAAED